MMHVLPSHVEGQTVKVKISTTTKYRFALSLKFACRFQFHNQHDNTKVLEVNQVLERHRPSRTAHG
jgi:hypothetical protein